MINHGKEINRFSYGTITFDEIHNSTNGIQKDLSSDLNIEIRLGQNSFSLLNVSI